MSSPTEWTWEIRRDGAGTLHEPTPPVVARRTVHEMLVDAPALVLGSSQPEADIDHDGAARSGISVVRRRSGGGAVLLVPGEHVWLDLWLPSGDPLWVDDVGRAGDWLAEVWMTALTALGFSELGVQEEKLDSSVWSSRVCFAGLGASEVTVGGRKLVGVSQRRTRDWVRFQCLVHRRWDAGATFRLLAAEGASAAGDLWRDRVADVGTLPVVSAFEDALTLLR